MSAPSVAKPEPPTITTERLRLRPLHLDDAPELQRLAGDRAIAATTIRIPHPYPDGAAEAFINSQHELSARGLCVSFVITERADGGMAGGVGLEIAPTHAAAELGYWIARPFWGRGFATEAAAAVVTLGFETLGLERIHAHHFHTNPASGRVLEKIGMQHEGTLRRHVRKWGEPMDCLVYGILRNEYHSSR